MGAFTVISAGALLFLQRFCSALPAPNEPYAKRTTSGPNVFDYVIVGGGTAGLVLAERLTENPNITVAVVEAGVYNSITSPLIVGSLPPGSAFFVGSDPTDANPLNDWVFVTQPQAGANGRTIHYAQGMTLGGSSCLNLLIYQRPTVGSLQRWAQDVGDDSYNWDNFLPFYKKSPNFTAPHSPPRPANSTGEYNPDAFNYGAAAGPLQVSYPNYVSPWASYVQGGFLDIGIPEIQDLNSGELIGQQYCSLTLAPQKETRSQSQNSFLNMAQGRDNLSLFIATLAKKILFTSDGDTPRATGVVVSTAGVEYTLTAQREVIVSAGTFHSPQLLIVSGVGPAADLQRLQIPTVKELPGVGQNMQDQVFFGPSYRVKFDTITRLANDPVYLSVQVAKNLAAQQGPLTSSGPEILAWEKIPESLRENFSSSALADLATFPSDWPEVEYANFAAYLGNFSNPLLTQPKDGYQYASVAAVLVAPLSRGNITVISPDTAIKPLINPNWLTSTTDQQVAIASFKRLRETVASSFVQQVVIGPEYFPGPSVSTDAQILEAIRENLMTIFHASCTCRMGMANDTTAVVDNKARVYGVDGLRVVDASALPFLPPGHPQSTVYALAEKIAADILSEL